MPFGYLPTAQTGVTVYLINNNYMFIYLYARYGVLVISVVFFLIGLMLYNLVIMVDLY